MEKGWGHGDWEEDKGTGGQLACPKLSMRTEMCRAGVHIHMVRATRTNASSHDSQSDLSATSSGLLAQAC